MSYQAKLVPGEPDKISVMFLGRREIVDRAWFEQVRWLANCSELALLQARAKRKAGQLCELDHQYWFDRVVKPRLQEDLPCPFA